MKARRRSRKKHEDAGEFLWLVSLSDLMILLFMLFVALFSFSKHNMKQEDVKRMIEALRNKKPEVPPVPVKNPMDEINASLNRWAKQSGVAEQVTIEKREDGVFVQIKDRVLFGVGEYELHPEGMKAASSLAQVLKKVPKPYQIGIEGHTDDTPIHTSRIQNNWQLSAERALAVLQALNLPPELLKRTVLLAHGEMSPLVPNRDAKGMAIAQNQSRNRRVTVRIFQ
jgi:chemotaxis protein MotB